MIPQYKKLLRISLLLQPLFQSLLLDPYSHKTHGPFTLPKEFLLPQIQTVSHHFWSNTSTKIHSTHSSLRNKHHYVLF